MNEVFEVSEAKKYTSNDMKKSMKQRLQNWKKTCTAGLVFEVSDAKKYASNDNSKYSTKQMRKACV